MKTKKYFSIVITILFAFLANAQTVTLYTPSGSSVQAFMQSEMSASDITYYTNAYRAGYPQATVLANASSTYNCHSYAWNISEGGTSICWLNQAPDLHKYWDDFSYEETTEANAEKIFYFNGDHSAIKSTTVAGKYESKWGPMPLMRHAPDYGPNGYNMSYRRYYAKFSSLHPISGSSQLCSQGTYTINNLPAGATVVWSATPSGVVSLQPNGSSVTLTKVGNNRITLSANVNNSYTLTKSIWVGPPYISSIYGPTVVCYTEENGYGANVEGEPTSYNWTIPGIARAVDDNYNSDVIRLVWDQYVEAADFSLSVCNECGTAERTVQITMPLSCWYYYNSYFSLSPNPATTSAMLTINDIQDANVSTNANLLSKSTANKLTSVNEVCSVKVTNSFGLQVYTAKKYGKSFSIPVDNLANGIYVVEITSGKGSYRKQLVVKH
jgi:hypothetical protein